MDIRLEKIRKYEANVKDFDSYINDRVRTTKKENVSESVDDEYYQKYGLEPNDILTKDCLNYIINNIYNFDRRYSVALDKIKRLRISLEHADTTLFDEIYDAATEFYKTNRNIVNDNFFESIEEIFG